TGSRKKLIALIAALVILLIGTFAASALFFLNKGSSTQTGTSTPTTVATQKPAPLAFTPGTSCSTATANPVEPVANPTKYQQPAVIDHSLGGSPAFIGVHYDGTVYYTDQQSVIYSLSPALPNHQNQSHYTTTGIPEGLAFTPNMTSTL